MPYLPAIRHLAGFMMAAAHLTDMGNRDRPKKEAKKPKKDKTPAK